MSAQPPSGQPLLLVIDPAARAADGESVRVAKDVLCAGAQVKVAIPESTDELNRALAHRGRRRPVVIGDDRALHRVVQVLHQRRELAAAALSHVPVGPASAIPLALALGLPTHPAPAARAALHGPERILDLLVDDRGGVVLGAVEISGARAGEPEHGGGHANGTGAGQAPAWWESVGRGARTLARGLRVPLPNQLPRLRVEADGVVLVDLDRPVRLVSVSNACSTAPEHGGSAGSRAGSRSEGGGAGEDEDGQPDGQPDDGLVEVLVRRYAQHGPVRVCARAVTVSGRNFSYAADAELTGPVRTRTWTVQPGAWRLTVPGDRVTG